MSENFENLSNVVAARRAVKVLNSALEMDPSTLSALVQFTLPCNDEISYHPTIQVQSDQRVPCRLSPLGLINGLFGVDERTGYGMITMVLNDDGSIEKFQITDFDKYSDRPA